MDPLIHDLISKFLKEHNEDLVLIDALYQWSMNPTSKSAGYGIDENYPFIKQNLKLRYHLLDSELDSIIDNLKSFYSSLARNTYGEPYKYRTEISEYIESIYGNRLRKEFLNKLDKSSQEVKDFVFMLAKLISKGVIRGVGLYADSFAREEIIFIKKLYRSTFDKEIPDFDSIVQLGMANKLLWITARGEKRPMLYFPDYLQSIFENIDKYITPSEKPSVKEYFEYIISQKKYSQLVILEEFLQSKESDSFVSTYSYKIKMDNIGVAPEYFRGIIDTIGNEYIVISPLIEDDLLKLLKKKKQELYGEKLKRLIDVINNNLRRFLKQKGLDFVRLTEKSFIAYFERPLKIFVDITHVPTGVLQKVDTSLSNYLFVSLLQPSKSIEAIWRLLSYRDVRVIFLVYNMEKKMLEPFSNGVVSPKVEELIDYLTSLKIDFSEIEKISEENKAQTPIERPQEILEIEANKILIDSDVPINSTRVSSTTFAITTSKKGKIKIKIF